jgi:hypothetical protein
MQPLEKNMIILINHLVMMKPVTYHYLHCLLAFIVLVGLTVTVIDNGIDYIIDDNSIKCFSHREQEEEKVSCFKTKYATEKNGRLVLQVIYYCNSSKRLFSLKPKYHLNFQSTISSNTMIGSLSLTKDGSSRSSEI